MWIASMSSFKLDKHIGALGSRYCIKVCMSSWGNAFKSVLLSVLEIPAPIISHERSIHPLVSVPAAVAEC